MQTKQKIAVIGMARTGTTLMASSLDQIPGVRVCWREIFNPNVANRHADVATEGLPPPPPNSEDQIARSHWFNEQALPQLRDECETHYGYKIVDASLARSSDIMPLSLSDPGLKVIVMSRNPMAAYLSNCVCMTDNVWDRTLEQGPLASPPPTSNMDMMNEWVQRTVQFWQLVTTSPWAKAIVTYKELVLHYDDTMKKVCEWLGCEWNGADKPLSRTRPEMVKERIPDMAEIWPITPALWARDMYKILSEEPSPEGPYV